MHLAMLAAILMAGTFPVMAQEVALPPKAPAITREFTPIEVQNIVAICELAIWANRIGAEPPCNLLRQKLIRTPADDEPKPDGK